MSEIQTHRNAESPLICDTCGLSLTPLKTVHVERACKECGRTIYLFEPGENGNGMLVREGDSVRIPKDFIRFSFNPMQSMGRLTKFGLSWLAQTLFFEGQPKNPAESDVFVDLCESQANAVVKASELLAGFDLENMNDADKALKIVQERKDSLEWWAMAEGSMAHQIRESLINNDARTAVWATSLLMNARAMLIFKQSIENVAWRKYNARGLREVLAIWNANRENAREEFWQSTLADNAFVLSQVFASPAIVLEQKAYVGGKAVSNSRGNIVDFLVSNGLADNLALIEIKTPKTRLLGSVYRGVFAPSTEVAGAVLQVQGYKDSLIKHYTSILAESDQKFEVFDPQCIVIAGSIKDELVERDQRRSFELFRRGLKDVHVISYDEIFRKIETLVELLDE